MSANGPTLTLIQIRRYSVPKRLVDNRELFAMPNTWLYRIEHVFFLNLPRFSFSFCSSEKQNEE